MPLVALDAEHDQYAWLRVEDACSRCAAFALIEILWQIGTEHRLRGILVFGFNM